MQAVRPSKEELGDRDGLRYVENPAGEQLLPSVGEAEKEYWPAPMLPIIKSSPIAKNSASENDHNHDSEYQHNDHEHHHKKSVLAKVKDKAKKWRLSLSRKKHIHEDEGITTPTPPPSPTPAPPAPAPTPSISFDDGDRSIEQDPEYHGAPMYESEMAPKMYKERGLQIHAAVPSPKTPTEALVRHPATTASEVPLPPPAFESHKGMDFQHEAAVPSLKALSSTLNPPQTRNFEVPQPPQANDSQKEPKLHHLDSFKDKSTGQNLIAPATAHTLVTETEDPDNSNVSGGNNKLLLEAVTEILAPAYNMVSDATSKIAATIHTPRDESGAKMMWDKGVSVKGYLLQKLEPGEEERALSQVITEVISPRKAAPRDAEEKGVVEKVRGAVSLLLGKEEQTGAQQVHPTAGPHQRSSRPLFKDTQEASILVSGYKDGSSILASKATREPSISASKDTHETLIVESKHTDGAWNPFSEEGHEVLIQKPEYTHEASMPASKGTHGASIHAFQHTHGTSIPASDHIRATSILNSTHTPGDSSPLPVSTNPSFAAASTNSSPILFTANPSLVNVSTSTSTTTFKSSTNPHAEVQESNGRRLQAYTN